MTLPYPTKLSLCVASVLLCFSTAQGGIVQTNTTYTDISDAAAVTSSGDLANLGQPTYDSFTVSANQGGDGAADDGFIDGVTAADFANMTWFHNSHFPATNTVTLDVTVNTNGYNISEISSIAGWGTGEQADQVMTVAYSVTGAPGFTLLGTFTNTAAGSGEFSRIRLTEASAVYLATGVDALRFTYAATGNHLVLQEIDVIGVAIPVPLRLELASMFSDDMILQQGKAVPVWGTSYPGATITVAFAGQTNTATVSARGIWRVDLDPMVASTQSRTMAVNATLDAESVDVSVANVLVGEVWVCSGQSNMWWKLINVEDGAAVVAAATHPTLRLFQVPIVDSATPVERIDAVWTECTPVTAQNSFGVAYYFARKLQAELNVPVGLIQCAKPASAIEEWYPGTGVYFNGMVDAQIPFAMRGAVWYQGESNVADLRSYTDKKTKLIEEWRGLWGDTFPFYYVQLAPYNYTGDADGALPWFWEAQSMILGEVTNTGMAVISDAVDDLEDIHPTNKIIPGTRLALLALDHTYGQDIVSTGPTFQSLESAGNALVVTFDSADGLTTRDGLAPTGFELAVADGVYTSATAVVIGNKVMIRSATVTAPTAMRFAWDEVAQPNLVNGAGLVASSFRAGGLIRDNYSGDSLTRVADFYRPNALDRGWRSRVGDWSTAGGVLSNGWDVDGADAEGAVIKGVSVSDTIRGHMLRLSFDYTLAAAGESLSVYLLGSRGFYANPDARIGNYNHAARNGVGRYQYLELDMDLADIATVEFAGGATISESAPSAYLGTDYAPLLTLTGVTFQASSVMQEVDLTQWGFSGVEDFDYITLVFARDAVPGAEVTIDNVRLDAGPLPRMIPNGVLIVVR